MSLETKPLGNHTRLTISRVIRHWIILWPWNLA